MEIFYLNEVDFNTPHRPTCAIGFFLWKEKISSFYETSADVEQVNLSGIIYVLLFG